MNEMWASGWRAGFAAFFVLALSGCGAPAEAVEGEEPLASESSALKNGTLVNGSAYWRGVVKVEIYWPQANAWIPCSGQVTSKATVVTAAHCVTAVLSNVSSGNVTARITRETSTQQWLTVMPQGQAFAKYHPFYDGSAYRDIMVLTASSPFSNVVQTDAAPINKAAPTGVSMITMGYGYYDVSATDGQGRSGVVTPTYDANAHEYDFTATASQPWICSGDSGGPLKKQQTSWLLTGVVSGYSLRTPGDKCGNQGRWASTFDNWQWLQAAIGYDKCTEASTALFCW